MNQPRWYRSAKEHVFGWEIYSWKSFFLSICIGKLEIQINKW